VPTNLLENLASQIQKLAKNLANPKDKEKYMELKDKHYREFLNKINKSNNYDVKFPIGHFQAYKYYIGKGNNSILVRGALKTRFWWSMGDFDTWEEYNFLWTQWRSKKINDAIKSAPKTEDKKTDAPSTAKSDSHLSTQVTDKDSSSSVENLITTPKRSHSKGPTLANLQKKHDVVKPTVSTNAKGVKPKEEKEENPTQHSSITTNHMDANFHLSNKKALFYNMKVYYESTGQYPFDFLPLTFHITDGVNSSNFEKFQNIFNDPEQSTDLLRNPQLG
jgi:hypothetical protein